MSLLNTIAILGRQPELGLVELESLLGAAVLSPFGRQAVLINDQVSGSEQNSLQLDIDRLGGVMKLGRVIYQGPLTSLRELPIDLAGLPINDDARTTFALSVYGSREPAKHLLAAGLELKKQLRARGSVRLVSPAEGLAVSAAELRHNRVLEQGFELLVVQAGGEMVVALTTGVQDIDWYSRRDYERPARDAKVGMLPPKLAQILVNTARGEVVMDPFCGTGVILQEARLLGRAVVGSDLAPEMVAATTENMTWLEREVERPLPAWRVLAADARRVTLPDGAAVVSEGYLGTNQSKTPTLAEVEKLRSELLPLYCDALKNWAKQLPSGADVSLCVPAWRVGSWQYLGLVDELSDMGYTLKGFTHARTSLLYAREDTIVGRQLLLLRKD